MGQVSSLPPVGKYNGSGDITSINCDNKVKTTTYNTKINLVLINDNLCNKYIIQIKNKFFNNTLLGMIENTNNIIILDNNIYHTLRYEKNDTTGTIIHTYNGNLKNKHITGCEKYTFDLPPP
jgi:hypothetical protein